MCGQERFGLRWRINNAILYFAVPGLELTWHRLKVETIILCCGMRLKAVILCELKAQGMTKCGFMHSRRYIVCTPCAAMI